jgi:hypothetical protein
MKNKILTIYPMKMSENNLRELFLMRKIYENNRVERYQKALIRYGKQSFGIYWKIFRDYLEIKEEFAKPYKS